MLGLLCALLFNSAAAEGCAEFDVLQRRAAQARLTEVDRVCLQALQANTGTSEQQLQASFVLVVDAYATQQLERYERLMRDHLAIAPGDAEVAFLLSTHLHRTEGRSDDEVMHWARVALDGRRRWVDNRNNHDRMVRTLYDTLVESGMQRAIAAEASGSPNLGRYRREAKYWMSVAGPCLHNSACGPYYDVEIEGYADCDDLDVLEKLRSGVSDSVATCLRTRFRKPGQPRARILALLMVWADTGLDTARWDQLRAWHWRATESEDPDVLLRHARWLVSKDDAHGAVQVAEAALSHPTAFRGRAAVKTERALLTLVIRQSATAGVPWKADAARVRLVALD